MQRFVPKSQSMKHGLMATAFVVLVTASQPEDGRQSKPVRCNRYTASHGHSGSSGSSLDCIYQKFVKLGRICLSSSRCGFSVVAQSMSLFHGSLTWVPWDRCPLYPLVSSMKTSAACI